MKSLLTIVFALFLAACGSKSSHTAESVCKQLEAASVGTACVEGSRQGLKGKSTSAWEITLPHGEQGSIMQFSGAADFNATVEAFEEMSLLAGPHRYGNGNALIFVQLNSETEEAIAQKAKGVVDGL
jgi:hypothetical protein